MRTHYCGSRLSFWSFSLVLSISLLAQAKPVSEKKPKELTLPGNSAEGQPGSVALPEPKLITKKKSIPQSYFWLGGGFYYLIYQQKSPTSIIPVDYRGIASPSTWLDIRQKIYKNYGLRFEYQSQSGGKVKSDSLVLTKNDIKWTYSTVGFDYLLNRTFKFGDYYLQPSYLLAYQTHTMPFLKVLNTTTAGVENLQFNSVSIGYYLALKYSQVANFFITNRLQIPVNKSREIKVTSGLSFDGTIGWNYQLASNFSMAIYWGGQYHRLKYEYGSEKGDYELASSKLNLLIGTSW